MTIILRINHLNWYKNIQFKIELLTSFIEGAEEQVKIGIDNFYSKSEIIFPDISSKEDDTGVVAIHRGLDSETWNLESIFVEHFPNLQRLSSLITLYSFLESELNNLCDLLIEENAYKITLKDLNGKGINRAVKFLKKIEGLSINTNSKNWNEITRIRELRNLIVHNNGILSDKEQPYVNSNKFLKGNIGDEVTILEGFLARVLSVFTTFFKEIDTEIKKKYDAKPAI